MPDQDRGELTNAARNALLARIAELGSVQASPNALLSLAEAFAWVTYPDNAHGGKTGS